MLKSLNCMQLKQVNKRFHLINNKKLNLELILALENNLDLNLLIENSLKSKKERLNKLFLNQTDILSLYKRPESDSSSSSSLVASSVSGKTSNLISTTQMQESSTPQQMTAAYSFDSFDDQYGQMQPYVYSMLCGSLSDTKPYACVNHQQTQQTQP